MSRPLKQLLHRNPSIARKLSMGLLAKGWVCEEVDGDLGQACNSR
ncbi:MULTISPECIES: hypothetical protein [Corynebacterium]|nr:MULTISPECIES: hypothetical protein [Corynebacterium]